MAIKHAYALGASILALSAHGALAQQAQTASELGAAPVGATDVAEIVVTAQRRSERVQDVPISMAVVGAGQLDRQQVVQLNELSKTSASLQFTNVAGSAPGGGASIRGIGTTALSRGAEAAVGVVVDGVVQGNTNINNLFDIKRVEVLRGPQGTLFGQSTSAGVINISTVAPDPQGGISGKVSTDLSFDDFAGSQLGRQFVRGAVNLPVTENSALRLSGYLGRTEGILHNAWTNKDDSYSDKGIRARYLLDLDRVRINLAADYNRSVIKNGAFFTFTTPVSNPVTAGTTTPAPGSSLDIFSRCGVTVADGNLQTCSGTAGLQTSKVWGGSGQIDAELGGGFTLTSITALRKQHYGSAGDIDGTPFELSGLNIASGSFTKWSQFTQEVRIASDQARPLTVTVGGFYQDFDTDDRGGPDYGGQTYIGNPISRISANAEVRVYETKALSGFGEARYRAGDFTAFLGARLTNSRTSYKGTRQGLTLLPTGAAPGAFYSANIVYKDTDVSWRAGAQYAPSRELMFYATAARGYKNAQMAPIAPPLSPNGRIVLPEKPLSYEAGVKSSFFDGRLAVNGDVFHGKVKNFQAQVATRDPITQSLNALPINLSEVTIKGVEGDVFGRIGPHFTLNASAIYNEATYPKEALARNGDPIGGRQIAYAPKFVANLSGEYERTIGGGDLEGFVSFDITHKSRTRLTDELANMAIASYKGYETVGGRMGLRVDDKWSVALFVANAGNVRVPVARTNLPGQGGSVIYATAYTAQSVRQVGLQAQLEF